MSRSFFDFFPPPEFLAMKPVGISVSSDAVRAVSFKHSAGNTRIDTYFEKILPVDTIVDAEIKRTNDLISILREAKNAVGAKFARIALPEEKSFLFEANVSAQEGMSLRESVEFILEENVPVSPADTVFDFIVVPEEKEDGKEHVVVSVFPRSVIEPYLSIVDQVGITPLAIELDSQSAATAAIASGDNRTYALLIVGKEKGTIAIVKRGVVRFSSTFILNPSIGVGNEDGVGDSVKLLTIGEEMRKVVSYWQGAKKDKSSKIDSVLLLGDLKELDGLDAHISETIAVSTKRPNVWQNLFSIDDYVPEISLNDSLKFSSAVGTVINK